MDLRHLIEGMESTLGYVCIWHTPVFQKALLTLTRRNEPESALAAVIVFM